MGTANFAYNTDLYANDNSDNEFAWGDTKMDIECTLKEGKIFKDLELKHVTVTWVGDEDKWDSNSRSYEGLIVATCSADIDIDDIVGNENICYRVEQRIIMRGGYYSGFNLDRDYEGDYDISDKLDEVLPTAREMVDEQLDIEHYFEEDEDVMDIYIDRCIKPKIETMVLEIEDEFDKVYHKLGESFFESYRVTARFSNGETFYEKCE